MTFNADGTFESLEYPGNLFMEVHGEGTWSWLDKRARTMRILCRRFRWDLVGTLNAAETELTCDWPRSWERIPRIFKRGTAVPK